MSGCVDLVDEDFRNRSGVVRLLECSKFKELSHWAGVSSGIWGSAKRCVLEVTTQQRIDGSWNHGQVSICFQLFWTCLIHLNYNRRGGCLGAIWDNYFVAFPTLHVILVILANKIWQLAMAFSLSTFQNDRFIYFEN